MESDHLPSYLTHSIPLYNAEPEPESEPVEEEAYEGVCVYV